MKPSEHGYWYRDGALFVLVAVGAPEDSARVGVGDTVQEAIDSLEATALQSTGRYPEDSALSWAHGAGWISDPETLDALDDAEVDALGGQS